MTLTIDPRSSWQHFYRVIDADMKVKCFENKCANVFEAVDVVERYEALYEDKKEGRRSTVRVIEAAKGRSTDVEQVLKKLEKLESRQMEVEKKLQQKTPRNPEHWRVRQEVTCFGCGEKGHYKSDCPAAPFGPRMDRRVSFTVPSGRPQGQGNFNPLN